VRRYATWLEAAGSTVVRKEITLPDLGHALYADLFDRSRAELVEAKSSAARSHVRLAVGQILDYARFVEHKSRAVLLPSDPGPDLRDPLSGLGIACIFEDRPGVFTRVKAEPRPTTQTSRPFLMASALARYSGSSSNTLRPHRMQRRPSIWPSTSYATASPRPVMTTCRGYTALFDDLSAAG
jgi:hypothetical protein